MPQEARIVKEVNKEAEIYEPLPSNNEFRASKKSDMEEISEEIFLRNILNDMRLVNHAIDLMEPQNVSKNGSAMRLLSCDCGWLTDVTGADKEGIIRSLMEHVNEIL